MKKYRARTVIAVAAATLLAVTAGAAGAASAVAAEDNKRAPAIDQSFSVIREAAEGLEDRTIYRPAYADEVGHKVPILVWSNGGCRASNTFFISTLTLLASHGFIVIADGAPDAPSDLTTPTTANPQRMIDAIDWVTEDPEAKEQLGDLADTSKISVAGQSCGGVEAIVAGADPRVDSVMSLNSGLFPDAEDGSAPLGFGRDNLANLHSPILFVHGGPEAVEYQNSVDNYNLVTVPAALVGATGAGHAGIFYGIRNNTQDGTVVVLEQGVNVMTQWLDLTLNGQKPSVRDFNIDGWTGEVKGY